MRLILSFSKYKMDYRSYLNEIGLNRKSSPIRAQHEKLVEMVKARGASPLYLSGGMPNTQTFPALKSTFELRDGSVIELDNRNTAQAMQYDASPGNADLLDWFYELQRQVHNPPTYNNPDHPGNMRMCITNGSQHGMAIMFENLIDKGDIILVENPIYAGAVAVLKPLRPNAFTVDTDDNGIIPEKLQEVLSRWDGSALERPGKDGPKLLYCVPTCGNPTGVSMTLERKKAVYQLARKYKFLILEDDAYFYLKEKPYIPSFLSMDVDGRVVRFDTMSKVLAAGLRIGLVTGPKPLLDLVKNVLETSIQCTSGLSQLFMLNLLKKWGYNGFYEHAESLAEFYAQRRTGCIDAANKHLKDVAVWNNPTGGMFMWIRLKVPDASPVVNKLIEKRETFVVPGSDFMMKGTSPYIRVSFSYASIEEVNKAFESLAITIKEHLEETNTA